MNINQYQCFFLKKNYCLDGGNIYRLLMKSTASFASSISITGRMGPKISSCITGSVGLTSTKIVGSIHKSSTSVLPPTATLPLFNKPCKRLKKKRERERERESPNKFRCIKTWISKNLLEMSDVDYPAKIGRLLGISTVELYKNFAHFGYQGILKQQVATHIRSYIYWL